MNIIIFNSLLLPPSQTFIRAQGEMLKQFTPYYVGSRCVPGLSLPPERTFVVNQGTFPGKVAEGVFKAFSYSPALNQQLKQIKPVLIHAQFGLSGVLALPLARSRQIPLIVHFRGADATITRESSRYESFNHWLYFRRRQTLQREATCFLTVSKFIKQKLVEQGYPSEKIIPHYHGVDLTQFNPNFDYPREPIILFVGRLTEKKGCQYLIQAVTSVQVHYPTVKLVIIGEGILRSKLEALAENSLYNYQFLGIQSTDIVKHWMNRASILVAPSITASDGDSEGLPNVVLEAQAMGLPVVSTYHAGIPEAVKHGETGFLTAERDTERLAQYCLQLLENPQLWQKFSHAGRNNMIVNFNRLQQTQVLEKLYQEVIKTS